MSLKTLLAVCCASAALTLTMPAAAAPTQSFKSEEGTLEVTTVAKGLEHPWSVAFLPGQEGMLVTERPGNLRVVSADGQLSAPLSGVPVVWAKGQGGLLDVVLSPDFKQDRTVYLSYAEAGPDGKAGTAVGRGQLSEDLRSLKDFDVIFRQQPKLSTGNHFGSRLVFDRDGYLFITLGKTTSGPPPKTWTSCKARSCASTPTARCPTTIPSSARRTSVPRSGPTACATPRCGPQPVEWHVVGERTRPQGR